jgi:hypothetical protein
MKTWEYLTIKYEDHLHEQATTHFQPDAINSRLNEYGKQGWELVSFLREWNDGP